jgi:hypothetical protein
VIEFSEPTKVFVQLRCGGFCERKPKSFITPSFTNVFHCRKRPQIADSGLVNGKSLQPNIPRDGAVSGVKPQIGAGTLQ